MLRLRSWFARAKKLFGEAQILGFADEGKTMTHVAVETMMQCPPLTYQNDKVWHAWGPGSKEHVNKAMESMSTVYSVAEKRLEAEFPRCGVRPGKLL